MCTPQSLTSPLGRLRLAGTPWINTMAAPFIMIGGFGGGECTTPPLDVPAHVTVQ
jgi:hypothetical protein